METYMKGLNLKKNSQGKSDECDSKIRSIFSSILHAIYGIVCIQIKYSLMLIVKICKFFLLSSLNRKHNPFAIV